MHKNRREVEVTGGKEHATLRFNQSHYHSYIYTKESHLSNILLCRIPARSSYKLLSYSTGRIINACKPLKTRVWARSKLNKLLYDSSCLPFSDLPSSIYSDHQLVPMKE